MVIGWSNKKRWCCGFWIHYPLQSSHPRRSRSDCGQKNGFFIGV